jgi:2-methylcitrate dehydratase PrpD
MGIELKADGVTGASQGAISCQQGQETQSAVERIAAFAVAARPERLTPEIRRLFKRNILDSLACAIAALPGRPFAALRDQFEEYRAQVAAR